MDSTRDFLTRNGGSIPSLAPILYSSMVEQQFMTENMGSIPIREISNN